MSSRRLQALIDDPPPKSPYFTLPSVNNIIIYTGSFPGLKRKRKTAPNTITKIWGPSRKMTEESKTNFLANLLRFATIDFDAMAKDIGIASGDHIKQRLNTIIRGEGYKLEGDQVIPAPDDRENHIVVTTEFSITEAPRDDTPEVPTAIIDEITNRNVVSPRVTNRITKAATKLTRKRKAVDGKTPKEVLKKKQKKAVEESMRGPST